ncbi:MAG: tRNA preQ1(34) S-adenosylmethionine ribosyltransferase-isomerase QueA [Hyphomicrobiales bacterium]|nr:tRNA preQ1(34) S-adenosylmethionine ribosyltransferase-isomerase QueA [Hyphomicrobiales bacterium]
MNLDEFDFDLPVKCIAQRPVSPRDASRLLRVDHSLSDNEIRDLPRLLQPGDLLVCNDTKVIPVRLKGRRGEVVIDATLHKQITAERWRAFLRPARRIRQGHRIDWSPDFSAVVDEKYDGGEVMLHFDRGGDKLMRALSRHGSAPLPPYIKRTSLPDARDRDDYQTVFARHPGAVAAPTAGLHFTPRLLQELADQGISRAMVTLHVGAGTFLPVKTGDIQKHTMHAEWGEIGVETATAINTVHGQGGRIIAVGTTSLRLLETAADDQGYVHPFAGDTDLFITPGYRFKVVDLLLTNFHLPRSSLFILVSAFSGLARMKQAYAHAVNKDYRFYSYGDACLLVRKTGQ